MSNVRIKVQDGTRSLEAKRLCDSCHSGTITRGPMHSQERVFCSTMRRNVTIKVIECTDYRDKSKPSLYHLEKIAWVLQTDRKRQAIGFLSATEWRKHNADEEVLPPGAYELIK
jgi:hypothetical protein